MIATDLMIGDYCKCGDTLVKITRISETSASGLDLVALEPIPLTKEILQDNGWDCSLGSYAYYKISEDKMLTFYWYEHRLTKTWTGIDEWQNHSKVTETTFHCEELNYVHKFQHALRLCCLDELANKFKVE